MKGGPLIALAAGGALLWWIGQRGKLTGVPGAASWPVFVKIYQGKPVEILRGGALESARKQARAGAPFTVQSARVIIA